MISINKLVDTLLSFHEKTMTLPYSATYTQKTAYDIRRKELEVLYDERENKTSQAIKAVCDYTMSKDFGNKPLNVNANVKSSNANANSNANTESNVSSLSYMENQIIDIPKELNGMLSSSNMSVNDWYIYGIKNPNGFFKSILMLNNPDYILRTNSDKNNTSLTLKREIAIQLDTLYKQYKYQQWNFKKLDMVNQLLNETCINYALIIATSDYIKKSIIILDISKREYQVYQDCNSSEWYLIIKDGQNYLPMMNSTGVHTISEALIKNIKNNYDLGSIEVPFKMVNYNKVANIPTLAPAPAEITEVNAKDKPRQVFVESKMTLTQLQEYAKVRGFDITKEGKQGKQIAKTKKELCDELNQSE
jgi:hypothetical protein